MNIEVDDIFCHSCETKRPTRLADLASGIYFARLMTPEYTKSIKMVLLK